jgi:hypothetical protein
MRILITNNTLAERAGSELYVRDLALELLRRGHHPVAYSTYLGAVADELRAATIPVIRSLDCLGEAPDIIHGHHHYETLTAMLAFPQTPAISYCHGWSPAEEAPLRFPRILRYVAVDEVCRERLIAEGGIAPELVETIFNFFDPERFPPRPPLPATPRTALAFSNEFQDGNGLEVLREACARAGIELHAVGKAVWNAESQPGPVLARHDVVFAKARAAIEAMAVGAAVVLCRPGALGPMVSARNFAALRPLNFGVRTLTQPLTADLVAAELRQYDPGDAQAVSKLTREACTLGAAVDRIERLYERVIAEARVTPVAASATAERAVARYLQESAPRYKSLDAERGRLAQRATAAERSLAEREERLHVLEEDRLRWIGCCEVAERSLAEREERLRVLEEDRLRWIGRCEAAERPLAEREARLRVLEEDRLRWIERCEAAERELAAVRASASWRWTQTILHSWLARVLLGPAIRAVAARSRRPGHGG